MDVHPLPPDQRGELDSPHNASIGRRRSRCGLTSLKEGAVDKDVTNWNQGQPEAAFAADKAAMMINGPWFFGTLNSVKGLNYGVVEIPVNTPGQAVVGPIGGEVWTIPKSNPATEKGCLRAAQLHGRAFGRRSSRHQYR